MKNILIILIALAFANIAFAQSVVIKDSAGEPLLTINDEGTDQSSIGIPDAGSAFTETDDKLYNIGSSLYWSGDKIALTGSADGDWTIDANDMYSTVSGNVGIGNTAPETKLHVTSAGSEIARFESSAGSNWISFYNGSTKQGSVWNNNGTMTFRSETGPVKFQTNGNNDRMYIKTTGEVGIGTTSPGATLDVSGATSIFGSGNPRHLMLIKADGVTDNPGARLELEGTDGYPKQSFENWAGALRIFNDADISAQFGSDGGLYLGTAPTANDFPGAGNLIADGNVGIGTTTPEAKFHLFTGTGSFTGTHDDMVKAIIENDSEAYLEFNAVNYSGITFADDGTTIRSGVLFNHSDDYISLYTAGSHRLIVAESGNIGIGNTNPSAKLDVSGNSEINGNIDVVNGEVNRSANTGTANLVPIAYGTIQFDGTIALSTGNFTCTWSAATLRYQISITDELYTTYNYTTIVTPITGIDKIASTTSGSNNLEVFFYDVSLGTYSQNAFQFVTYKK